MEARLRLDVFSMLRERKVLLAAIAIFLNKCPTYIKLLLSCSNLKTNAPERIYIIYVLICIARSIEKCRKIIKYFLRNR